MTYKQIEASRELRLWIGQIIIPAVTTAAAVLYMNPELRDKLTNKAKELKNNIETKFKK